MSSPPPRGTPINPHFATIMNIMDDMIVGGNDKINEEQIRLICEACAKGHKSFAEVAPTPSPLANIVGADINAVRVIERMCEQLEFYKDLSQNHYQSITEFCDEERHTFGGCLYKKFDDNGEWRDEYGGDSWRHELEFDYPPDPEKMDCPLFTHYHTGQIIYPGHNDYVVWTPWGAMEVSYQDYNYHNNCGLDDAVVDMTNEIKKLYEPFRGCGYVFDHRLDDYDYENDNEFRGEFADYGVFAIRGLSHYPDEYQEGVIRGWLINDPSDSQVDDYKMSRKIGPCACDITGSLFFNVSEKVFDRFIKNDKNLTKNEKIRIKYYKSQYNFEYGILTHNCLSQVCVSPTGLIKRACDKESEREYNDIWRVSSYYNNNNHNNSDSDSDSDSDSESDYVYPILPRVKSYYRSQF